MLFVIPRRPTVVNLVKMIGIKLRKNISLPSGSCMAVSRLNSVQDQERQIHILVFQVLFQLRACFFEVALGAGRRFVTRGILLLLKGQLRPHTVHFLWIVESPQSHRLLRFIFIARFIFLGMDLSPMVDLCMNLVNEGIIVHRNEYIQLSARTLPRGLRLPCGMIDIR